MVATTKPPTDKRTALAWARRGLVRQIRHLIAETPTENRRGTYTYCRHERDVRNVARGYLADDFLDIFPEIVQDGDWPRTAAQLLSWANDFFAQFEAGDTGLLEFYTCQRCDNYR